MTKKTPAKRPWRRRNYFIKQELQGKYMFGIFFFGVTAILLFIWIFSYFTQNTLTIVSDDYSINVGSTPIVLLGRIVRTYWLFSVSGGLVAVIIAMFLTHRLAGPLFRFERTVEEMLKGNFSVTIYLRKKDEGKELSAMINKLNEQLSEQVEKMRSITTEMDDDLAGALQTTEADEQSRKKRKFALKRAAALNSSLREILYGFKTKNDV